MSLPVDPSIRPSTPVPGPPRPVVRQINEVYWQCGEEYLRENPSENEKEVHFYNYTPGMSWIFKVVRVSGQIARQTWLNGELRDSWTLPL